MISEKMSKLLERSAAMSSMYTESARLKEKYGAENVYDFGMAIPTCLRPTIFGKRVSAFCRKPTLGICIIICRITAFRRQGRRLRRA